MTVTIIIISLLILSSSVVLVGTRLKNKQQEIYYIPQGEDEEEDQEPGDFVEFLEPEDNQDREIESPYDPNANGQAIRQARAIDIGDVVISPDPQASSPLLEQFEHYMIDDKAYLDKELNLQKIATALGTNRVYISRLVNDIYKTSFPDYLTEMRVQYAKKYMKANPYASQETVAINSGFKSAQIFNKRFKDVTQMTPKQWIKSNCAQLSR